MLEKANFIFKRRKEVMKKTVKFLIMMIVIIALAVSMTACSSEFFESIFEGNTSETFDPYNPDPELCTHPSSQHFVSDYIPATCYEDGLERYRCYLCWTVVKEVVLPCEGHTLADTTAAIEPTCGEIGLTSGVYCYACSTWVECPEVIPPTGEHDFNGIGCSAYGPGYYVCLAGCHEEGVEGVESYMCSNPQTVLSETGKSYPCDTGKCTHCGGPTRWYSTVDSYWLDELGDFNLGEAKYDSATCTHKHLRRDHTWQFYCLDCHSWEWEWEHKSLYYYYPDYSNPHDPATCTHDATCLATQDGKPELYCLYCRTFEEEWGNK
jgi:hypothetical protein